MQIKVEQKIRQSDHRTLVLTVELPWTTKTKGDRKDRVEVFNYRKSEDFKNFVKETTDNLELRSCFDKNEDLEKSSVRWLSILRKIIRKSFTKIRIRDNRMMPELEKLFSKREIITKKISLLNVEKDVDELINLNEKLADIESSISEISAARNKARVKELLDDTDVIDGGNQAKIWAIKNKLIPKCGKQPPTAKQSENGVLVNNKQDLEELYV